MVSSLIFQKNISEEGLDYQATLDLPVFSLADDDDNKEDDDGDAWR